MCHSPELYRKIGVLREKMVHFIELCQYLCITFWETKNETLSKLKKTNDVLGMLSKEKKSITVDHTEGFKLSNRQPLFKLKTGKKFKVLI